ncbi:MAG TPA: PH domain-containing protein [Allosphingosinicella sp.]|jgi:putative membrane protein|uniref:PH domain-containing protein n=1 Tax=Allosphingosinicella sp. TaxID=2823234 RepID=UPI002F2905B3
MSGETAAVADKRLHPGTIAVRFLKEAPRTLIGLPAVLALMSDVGWGLIALLVLLSVVVLGFTQWLAWRRFQYGVGASEILIESGLFSRNRRSIPFERIQDLDIERGPLHRLFGLAKIKIETGAGGKDEGVLDSVTLREVDRLRQAIRAGQVGVAEKTGLSPDLPLQPESRMVFAMGPGRVLASGPFNFSLLWVAGLFGLLQTFDDWLPFDLYDAERWIGLAEQRLPGRIAVSAILAGLVLAFLLGFLTGIVRTTLRDWGFRLLVEGKRLRRVRGLFTRTEVVIPKRRVQLALLATGPLRRSLGIFELMLQTLGSGQGQGGLQTAAPFARTPEVDAIVAELPGLRLPGHTALEQVSSRHILRSAIRVMLLPALAIGVSAVWRPEALYFLPLLPLLLGGAFLGRRYHRYALSGELLFVQAGFWRRRMWALPVANAQTVSVSRSFLQRRLGLATLSIDTAGAPLLGGPRIVDLRMERARELRDAILGTLRQGRGRPDENGGLR